MTAFSALYPEILSEVPQADVIILDRSIRRAVRKFCEQTEVVRASGIIDVVAGQSEYTLPAVASREIVRIVRQGVWWGTGGEAQVFDVTVAEGQQPSTSGWYEGSFGPDISPSPPLLSSGETLSALLYNSAFDWFQIEADADLRLNYSSITVENTLGSDVLSFADATEETPLHGAFALRFADFPGEWDADIADIYAVTFPALAFSREYRFGHKSEDQQDLDHQFDQATISAPWQLDTCSYPDAFWQSFKPFYYQRLQHLLNIWPLPDASATGKIQATYALSPNMTATEIDDFVFDWYEILAAGALAELLAIKHKPWTDLNESSVKRREFNQGIIQVQSDRVAGFGDLDYTVGHVRTWT
jgi:hypothetical protein